MRISRRSFFSGMAACGALGASAGRWPFGGEPAVDPRLCVFVSDSHVGGRAIDNRFQLERLTGIVDDVLALDPRPAHVVSFGDVAASHGRRVDYEASFAQMKRLIDAGIRVTVTTGNHDHREAMFAVYGTCAGGVRVPGRTLSVVGLPECDLLLMDSLDENLEDGVAAGNRVSGILDAQQLAWAEKWLAGRTRPVFVGMHHPLGELTESVRPLKKMLMNAPAFSGYLHGHNHTFSAGLIGETWRSGKLFRSLCMPSTGHWGDIGFVLFRAERTRAVATLVQKEFYYPEPPKAGETPPALWRAIVRDKNGTTCEFPYAGA